MIEVPVELRQRLKQHGQEHVLAWWHELSDAERRGLLEQLQQLDLEQLAKLYAARDASYPVPSAERIAPPPVVRLGEHDPKVQALGGEALRRGEVAAILVAGGQGSRLGFEHPKGMFPIGPVSEKSLFQIHAEKVLALRRRYGKSVPLLVMTSDATHDETVSCFRY